MTNFDELQMQTTEWRRDLHRHPEFGFEEIHTSGGVAAKLRESGIEVVERIGGTGTVNDAHLAEEALAVATELFGAGNAKMLDQPGGGSEDFARFLEYVPECFVNLGNGADSKPLHNPGYDFNDDGLLHGARFHAAIARRRLPLPE